MPVLSFLLCLFIFLDLAGLLILRHFKKIYLFSPVSIIVFFLFFSSLISLIYLWTRSADISVLSFFVFLSLVFLISCIDILFIFLRHKFIKDKEREPRFKNPIDVSIIVVAVVTILFALVTYLQFKTIRTTCIKHGYEVDTISKFYSAMRSLYNSSLMNFSGILTQLLAAQKCLAYIFTIIAVYNFVFNKKLVRVLSYIPAILVYIVSMFLTSGRTELITFFAFLVLVVFFFYWDSFFSSKIEIICWSIIFVSIFVLLGYGFYEYAVLLGKKKINFISYAYQYLGSPILAFNNALQGNVPNFSSAYFGEHTLYFFYSLFSKMGINVPESTAINYALMPAALLENPVINTNIYTAWGRWYLDFGYAGMYILSIVWISLYSYVFYRVVQKREMNYFSMLYFFCIFPLWYFAVEDGFYSTFSLSFIYKFGYFSVFYYIFIGRHNTSIAWANKQDNEHAELNPAVSEEQ